MMFLLLYITSPSSFPKPLSPQEELECLKLVEQGDAVARDRLIEHNLRLVVHIVKKYYTTGDQDDLISIGTIGLIKAVDSFDHRKGIRLATYAARCIENEILMYFRTLRKSAGDLSLSEAIDADREGNTLSLYDVLSSEDSIISQVTLAMDISRLYELIETELDEREREIVRLRYGLGGCRELTQREVASGMDISRSYVSRIEKKALQKLAKGFSQAGGQSG
ncbi:MAG: RNA polymerase sporulation sigma factor SigK [Clostridiales bacterium]|nr:RNA polymerase sporulation sigma factor SigK [Clostridiales bacterium]